MTEFGVSAQERYACSVSSLLLPIDFQVSGEYRARVHVVVSYSETLLGNFGIIVLADRAIIMTSPCGDAWIF